jgi:hypothetical protein
VLCATLAFVYFRGVLSFIPTNYVRIVMRGFVYMGDSEICDLCGNLEALKYDLWC